MALNGTPHLYIAFFNHFIQVVANYSDPFILKPYNVKLVNVLKIISKCVRITFKRLFDSEECVLWPIVDLYFVLVVYISCGAAATVKH